MSCGMVSFRRIFCLFPNYIRFRVRKHKNLPGRLRGTNAPDVWPLHQGEPNLRGHFAAPEQLEELTELMCRQHYSDEHIRGILGENFRRACGSVWK